MILHLYHHIILELIAVFIFIFLVACISKFKGIRIYVHLNIYILPYYRQIDTHTYTYTFHYLLDQEQENFFFFFYCYGPDNKYYSLLGHTVLVAIIIQLCHCRIKAAIGNLEKMDREVCANKTLFAKSGSEQDVACCNLLNLILDSQFFSLFLYFP